MLTPIVRATAGILVCTFRLGVSGHLLLGVQWSTALRGRVTKAPVTVQVVQISKAVGATVIAVCRGAAKAQALKRLGAEFVIDQSADSSPLRSQVKVIFWCVPSALSIAREVRICGFCHDFDTAKLVKGLLVINCWEKVEVCPVVRTCLGRRGSLQKVAPKGVDVVYDPVGGKSFEEALKVVKWGAQILIIGFASGGIPKVRQQASIYSGISQDLSVCGCPVWISSELPQEC